MSKAKPPGFLKRNFDAYIKNLTGDIPQLKQLRLARAGEKDSIRRDIGMYIQDRQDDLLYRMRNVASEIADKGDKAGALKRQYSYLANEYKQTPAKIRRNFKLYGQPALRDIEQQMAPFQRKVNLTRAATVAPVIGGGAYLKSRSKTKTASANGDFMNVRNYIEKTARSNYKKENKRALKLGAISGLGSSALAFPVVSKLRDMTSKAGGTKSKVLTSLGIGLATGLTTGGTSKAYSVYRRNKRRKHMKKYSAAKTKALDSHPLLKGKQKTALPDKVQALIVKNKMKKQASALEKVAVFGPVGELSGLGVPSALGYALGRSMPIGDINEARSVKSFMSAKKGRGKKFARDALGFLIMPGYTGYRAGRGEAARLFLKKKKKK